MILFLCNRTKEKIIVEKKEISSKKAVSKLTTRFALYGVLILFVYKIIESLIQKSIFNNFSDNKILLYVSLGLTFSIILLITAHILCRLSTHDVLKKYKINEKDVDTVSKKLTNVFLMFIFLSIIVTIAQLYATLMYESKIQAQSIVLNSLQNQGQVTSELEKIDNEIISNFYTYKTNIITYTFIVELGFCISLIAIAPFQKVMINKYNT